MNDAPPETDAGRPRNLQGLLRSTDGVGGLISIGLGAVAVREALRLGLGSASRLDSGAFPLAIGLVMIGLGLLLLVGAARRGSGPARIPFGLPAVMILAALSAFAFLLPLFGLVPAAVTLMLLVSFAIEKRIDVADVLFALAIAGLAPLVFVNGLGMVLPVMKWPF